MLLKINKIKIPVIKRGSMKVIIPSNYNIRIPNIMPKVIKLNVRRANILTINYLPYDKQTYLRIYHPFTECYSNKKIVGKNFFQSISSNFYADIIKLS